MCLENNKNIVDKLQNIFDCDFSFYLNFSKKNFEFENLLKVKHQADKNFSTSTCYDDKNWVRVFILKRALRIFVFFFKLVQQTETLFIIEDDDIESPPILRFFFYDFNIQIRS